MLWAYRCRTTLARRASGSCKAAFSLRALECPAQIDGRTKWLYVQPAHTWAPGPDEFQRVKHRDRMPCPELLPKLAGQPHEAITGSLQPSSSMGKSRPVTARLSTNLFRGGAGDHSRL